MFLLLLLFILLLFILKFLLCSSDSLIKQLKTSFIALKNLYLSLAGFSGLAFSMYNCIWSLLARSLAVVVVWLWYCCSSFFFFRKSISIISSTFLYHSFKIDFDLFLFPSLIHAILVTLREKKNAIVIGFGTGICLFQSYCSFLSILSYLLFFCLLLSLHRKIAISIYLILQSIKWVFFSCGFDLFARSLSGFYKCLSLLLL